MAFGREETSNMDREITKQEFRELYVRYGQSKEYGGWTQEYWDNFTRHETGKRILSRSRSLPTRRACSSAAAEGRTGYSY